MIKGRTKTDFEFEYDEKKLNNMEWIDALADADDGDVKALRDTFRMILDKDTLKKLYDHVRTEDGRVPLDSLSNELKDIVAASEGAGKNS